MDERRGEEVSGLASITHVYLTPVFALVVL